MKVPARAKINTEFVRGGNLSSSLAGPLKTLRKINDPVVASRAPTRSQWERILNLHGFPETLESLGKLNDSASGVKEAQGLSIQSGTEEFTGKCWNPLGIAYGFVCPDETHKVLPRPLCPFDFNGNALSKLISRLVICS